MACSHCGCDPLSPIIFLEIHGRPPTFEAYALSDCFPFRTGQFDAHSLFLFFRPRCCFGAVLCSRLTKLSAPIPLLVGYKLIPHAGRCRPQRGSAAYSSWWGSFLRFRPWRTWMLGGSDGGFGIAVLAQIPFLARKRAWQSWLTAYACAKPPKFSFGIQFCFRVFRRSHHNMTLILHFFCSRSWSRCK